MIVGDLVVDDWVKIGDRCVIGEEHVDVGTVMLLMSFAPCAYAVMGGVKS